ncbi:hypothetical protein, partial [Serratia marcescens]|uniref:hypothetical protein n=1 Tax=Serratia marcescens TaxID=615 RepID=UPI00281460A3
VYIPVGLAATEAVAQAVSRGVAAARQAGAAGPVLACLMEEEGVRPQLVLDQEKVPSDLFPETAARVLSKLADYAAWRAQPPG